MIPFLKKGLYRRILNVDITNLYVNNVLIYILTLTTYVIELMDNNPHIHAISKFEITIPAS